MTVEAAPTQSFANTGKFFDILGLALKNAALTILTLTLYRFWARTSMRRRVWSRVWVLGDALEYTGSAMDLFRGFLISLPCFFLPAIFVSYIAPLLYDQSTASLLGIGFYLVAVPLVAAARYWMRRYQLSRTRWRGIRMALAGSAWTFAFASAGWTVLQWLSLGWYTPVARMNQARMLWQNARFGDQPFEFVDDGEPAQKGLWWPYTLAWLGYSVGWFLASAVVGFSVVALTQSQIIATPDPNNTSAMGLYSLVIAATVFAVWLVLLQFFWAPYNAAAMNRIASRISLDGARFKLKAKTFSLLFITLAGWLLIILSLGLLSPVAGFLRVRAA